jgi:hypothetical protein
MIGSSVGEWSFGARDRRSSSPCGRGPKLDEPKARASLCPHLATSPREQCQPQARAPLSQSPCRRPLSRSPPPRGGRTNSRGPAAVPRPSQASPVTVRCCCDQRAPTPPRPRPSGGCPLGGRGFAVGAPPLQVLRYAEICRRFRATVSIEVPGPYSRTLLSFCYHCSSSMILRPTFSARTSAPATVHAHSTFSSPFVSHDVVFHCRCSSGDWRISIVQ